MTGMLARMEGESTARFWFALISVAVGAVVTLSILSILARKFYQSTRDAHKEKSFAAAPGTENPSAFMTASMQAVILKLREQEKELERLHKMERERALQTERLSEEVTRNMPAGLLVVSATGIISSGNPAAEQVLGIRGLNFRRYSEALGENSDLTRLIAECLATGKISRREQVSHKAPMSEARQLGVTISPTSRGTEKISGAICLLSDSAA